MKGLLSPVRLLCCVSLGLCCALEVQAQLSTSGSEVLVNSLTENDQQHPDIAMDTSGNFVIVYESYGHDQEGWAILGQRFSNSGSKVSSEFTANFFQFGDQRNPAVAVDEIGNFAVVYQSDLTDGFGWGIMLSRFDSSGMVETDTLVNSTTVGQQSYPDVAMDHDGDLVVVWASISLLGDTFTIEGQRYDSSGTAQGSEFQINTSYNDFSGYPAVGMAYDGSFVVAWQSIDQDGDGHGIFAQRFNSSGVAQGSEFQVNSTTAGHQQSPAIAVDSAGDFTIVWQSFGQDGDDFGIYAQRYTADGNEDESEFQVSTTTSGAQEWPAIAMSYAGESVITWTSSDQDGSKTGVYMQVYDTEGANVGTETAVNSTTTNFQQFAAPMMSASASSMVIAWQDGQYNSTSSVDGDDFGTVMQLYSISGTLLPVELLDFEATRYSETEALLTWTTATEINNEGFYVQRSDLEQDHWETLGFVVGQGTTAAETDYSFVDTDPLAGENYYRLNQVDYNGKETLSEIRLVHFDSEETITVYPNPNRGEFYVRRSEVGHNGLVPLDYQVVDAFGRTVEAGVLTAPITPIQLHGLADGVYHLNIERDTGHEHHLVVISGRASR